MGKAKKSKDQNKKAEEKKEYGKASESFYSSKPYEKISLFDIVKAAVSYTLKAVSSKELLIIVFTLAWGMIYTLTAYLNKSFIDSAALVLESKDLEVLKQLLFFLGLLALIGVVDYFVTNLRHRIIEPLFAKVSLWCEEQMLTKASRMEYRYYNDQDTLNKLIRTNDRFADQIQSILDGVLGSFSNLTGALAFLFIMASIHWSMPLILVLFTLPNLFLYRFQTLETYYTAVHTTGATRRMWYLLNLLTSRDAMKEIRFGGIQDYLIDRHNALADEVNDIRLKAMKKFALLKIPGFFLQHLGLGIAMVFCVDLIYRGETSLGSLALIFTSGTALQGRFMQGFNSLADIRDSGRYIQDYQSLLETHDEAYELPEAVSLKVCEKTEKKTAAEAPQSMDIVFDSVSFTYPKAQTPSLKDLNLTIRQGEKIALLGENGSGKSTFVALLCGLYAPTSGTLTLGGQDISKDITLSRRYVSAALQEYQRYDMELGANIRMGNAYRALSAEETQKAAAVLGIDEKVKTLSKGYDTLLGVSHSGGLELSGGEWQKLILARTLTRDDARILILDEPTASLDAPSEAALYTAYSQITGDRTSILVSHRLGSVKIADRILVFSKGRLVEDGTHQSLMALNGTYKTLYTAQAHWYA